jgi:NAD(P)-dependent dehydrogenase (short-subunit alcohol dehydrogenase family)
MGLLDSRVCVLIGGAGSVGRARARLFLDEGAKGRAGNQGVVVPVTEHPEDVASPARRWSGSSRYVPYWPSGGTSEPTP